MEEFEFCGDECERDVDNVPISAPPECFRTENRTMPVLGKFRILDGTWGPDDGVYTRSDRLVRKESTWYLCYCPSFRLTVRVFLLRLFNLEEDPRETEDVSDDYPHIVEKLLLKLSDYYVSLLTSKLLRKCYYVIISNAFKDVQATPYYPEEDPRANPKNNNGVWGAWIKEWILYLSATCGHS